MPTYTCPTCGKTHEEWPSLGFFAPEGYHVLPEKYKQEIAEISDDFCIIRHSTQTDRFIRGMLTLKVIDHCEPLVYSVWVSLSEKSFLDYTENFGNNEPGTRCFGWLANDLPEYAGFETNIPTSVINMENGFRPEIVPHQDFVHPLVRDYYDGITKAEAERRINDPNYPLKEKETKPKAPKRWWKP